MAGLSPEAMQSLLGSATYDDQEKLLNEQMAQAYALRNRQAPQYHTGGGGPFGALAQTLDGVTANKQLAQNTQQQQALQQAYIKALQGAAGGAQQPATEPSYGP